MVWRGGERRERCGEPTINLVSMVFISAAMIFSCSLGWPGAGATGGAAAAAADVPLLVMLLLLLLLSPSDAEPWLRVAAVCRR